MGNVFESCAFESESSWRAENARRGGSMKIVPFVRIE